MNKEFVPYEEALALKELGFKRGCFGYYRNDDGQLFPFTYYEGQFDDLTLAPLYQQAFRWFREKHNLVFMLSVGTNDYTYKIFDEKKGRSGEMIEKDAYFKFNSSVEEAELACLRKLIEIVKNKS